MAEHIRNPVEWGFDQIRLAALTVGSLGRSLRGSQESRDAAMPPVRRNGTSIRAVAANPGPMAVWGLIVAAGLVIGSIPAFLGLIIVMPVLGHATWHLYRKVVP